MIALGLSGIVILGLAIPALGMKTHSDTLDTLPASIPQVQTVKDISASFPADEGASATRRRPHRRRRRRSRSPPRSTT